MNNLMIALLYPPIPAYRTADKQSCTAPLAALWISGLFSLCLDFQNQQIGFSGALGLLLWLTASFWSLLLIHSKKSNQHTNAPLYTDDPLLTLQQQMHALGNELPPSVLH